MEKVERKDSLVSIYQANVPRMGDSFCLLAPDAGGAISCYVWILMDTWGVSVFYISFWGKTSPLAEICKFHEINEISKKKFKKSDKIWSLDIIYILQNLIIM
jgi:hypothetical protein